MRKPFVQDFTQTQNWNDPRYRSSYTQFGLLGHNGEDYGLPEGTQVISPHDGIIKEATFDNGYGNYVKVESEEEGSVLAHLSEIKVNVGQEIKEGQEVGLSGNTGNSTGPHLHWGYYRTKTRNRDNGFLGYIDQTDWMDSEIIQLNDQTIIPKSLLEGEAEDLEIQQIAGLLKDGKRDNLDLENARNEIKELEENNSRLSGELIVVKKGIEDLTKKLASAKPCNALKTADYTWNGLLDYLAHVFVKRL